MRSATVGLAALLAGGVLVLCVGCPGDETRAPKEDSGAGAPRGEATTRFEAPASDTQKLIGLWKGTESMQGGPDAKIEASEEEEIELSVEFKDDGSMTMDVGLPVEMSGTWKLAKAEGNTLTVNTVIDTPSGEFSVDEEGAKATEKVGMKTEKEELEFTIVFDTDDRIIMAPSDKPDQPTTFERQR